jgi:flagellar L-ring protein precursor FlgH
MTLRAAVRTTASLAVALLAGAGCMPTPHLQMHQPALVRPPVYAAPPPPANGAIWQEANYLPLFEDRRARRVGDTLTIRINEQVQATKKASSSVQRESAASALGPAISIPPKVYVKPVSIEAKSGGNFEGKGDSAASNLFTGTITVTVLEVLPNGNLLVAGEKQIGINQGSEFVRLSGVVNPINIQPDNVVLSTQVAEARVEYRGVGYIDEAQWMGVLTRAFMSVFPF